MYCRDGNMEPPERKQIYVLLCKQGKYYVGCSGDFISRLHEHMTGIGSEWTRKYIPIRVVLLRDMISDFDEDSVTKEYMMKYGIDNVRGARYVEVTLPDDSKESIKLDIRLAQGKCLLCGKDDHYAKTCTKQEKRLHVYSSSKCTRCGRRGHMAGNCVARYDIRGWVLSKHSLQQSM